MHSMYILANRVTVFSACDILHIFDKSCYIPLSFHCYKDVLAIYSQKQHCIFSPRVLLFSIIDIIHIKLLMKPM